MTTKCRNRNCGDALPCPTPLGLCASCWWMAKVGYSVGAVSLVALAWIVGGLSKLAFTLPAWLN